MAKLLKIESYTLLHKKTHQKMLRSKPTNLQEREGVGGVGANPIPQRLSSRLIVIFSLTLPLAVNGEKRDKNGGQPRARFRSDIHSNGVSFHLPSVHPLYTHTGPPLSLHGLLRSFTHRAKVISNGVVEHQAHCFRLASNIVVVF